jgi:hypothetical protein
MPKETALLLPLLIAIAVPPPDVSATRPELAEMFVPF